jgi:hypothetical protein
LIDNATTRDLLSLLPLTLTLEDYANAEKIGYLPRRLDTAGTPSGADPSTGDIPYYAPWGNLAISMKAPPTREASFRSVGSTLAWKCCVDEAI